VLPDAATEYAPGAVLTEEDRILWVGPAADAPVGDVEVALPGAVLTPGLVNAHCHLDLTHAKGQVPYRGGFADWLRAVRGLRAQPGVAAAALEGLRGALRRGTTSVGDVVSPRTFADVVSAFESSGARGRLFVEALGFHPDRAEAAFAAVWELAEMRPLPPRVSSGLSPHAPYSVSRELVRRLVAVADGHARPLAVHVAETLEELAFLRHGIGPLREMLREFGADDPAHVPYGSVPGFLETLALERAPLCLVHGNYMRPRDIPAGAFVIYCPTAHQFFRHPEHPVLELLEEGVRVALGSDSAASGDTIDLLSETQFLARARLDLEPRAVFRMATEWGARALDLDTGVLHAGRLADLAAFEPPLGHEILGSEEARCTLAVVGGSILHQVDP